MDDDLNRALSAYYGNDGMDEPSKAASGVVKHDGLDYVCLRNSHRTLAVYRIRNDGSLKRMRRYPKELDTW